jgi:RNA polymerase sigma-70 factor (ECF subfamily)
MLAAMSGPRAALIDRHHAAGRAAYPTIDVSAERFAADLLRRLGDGASDEQVAKLRADHLYLAIACAGGDQAAIARFDADFLDEVDACAARVRARPDQAAEVRSHLRRILFVSEPGRPAATLGYTGKGDLRSYVRVIATRELLRVVGKGRREIGVDQEVLDLLSPLSDPELAYLRDRYRTDVDAAMRAALVAIDEQSRAVLRYSLVDGWSIDRIGALYGVHRATAARWIHAARDELGAAIRAAVAERLQISVGEVDSIVRLVQSRLDVSMARLLDS